MFLLNTSGFLHKSKNDFLCHVHGGRTTVMLHKPEEVWIDYLVFFFIRVLVQEKDKKKKNFLRHHTLILIAE